jgi:hypothetical protein
MIGNNKEVLRMAKQTVDAQAVALEALAQAFADPAAKVLLGSAQLPGFFKGSSKAVKDAARLCDERQWLVPTGEWVGKGSSRKEKYRLGPAGIQAVLQHGEARALLRGLTAALQQQVEVLRPLHKRIGELLAQRESLSDAVAQLTQKLEPPDVEGLVRRLSNAAPLPPAAPAGPPDWLDEAVRQAAEQRQRDRYQLLSLPQLYAALRRTRPALTLGQFHDGLRLLRDQGRIRLSPFTRALATIDDPRNALFLDGEVMYYVELP